MKKILFFLILLTGCQSTPHMVCAKFSDVKKVRECRSDFGQLMAINSMIFGVAMGAAIGAATAKVICEDKERRDCLEYKTEVAP